MAPTLQHLLSLLTLITLTIATKERDTNFIEAPFFHNSPHCPSPTNLGHTDRCCSKSIINIAMTLDDAYLRGSMAAILSVVRHSACPNNYHFHLIYSPSDGHLEAAIAASFPYLHFHTIPFTDEAAVRGRISTSVRGALDKPLNYARSYLTRLLPACLHRVVYLDSDVIVVDDISKLYYSTTSESSVIAAPVYCAANLSRYFTPTFWSNPALAAALNGRRSKACYFNTGVMVVDLERWREGGYTEAIEEWMEVQKRMRIYELGSLPPFLLVFAGEVAAVEPRWNQHGLGGDNYEGHCRGLHPGEASLLHWSGRGKPWVRLDQGRPCPVDALWAPYDLLKRRSFRPELDYS